MHVYHGSKCAKIVWFNKIFVPWQLKGNLIEELLPICPLKQTDFHLSFTITSKRTHLTNWFFNSSLPIIMKENEQSKLYWQAVLFSSGKETFNVIWRILSWQDEEMIPRKGQMISVSNPVIVRMDIIDLIAYPLYFLCPFHVTDNRKVHFSTTQINWTLREQWSQISLQISLGNMSSMNKRLNAFIQNENMVHKMEDVAGDTNEERHFTTVICQVWQFLLISNLPRQAYSKLVF